MVISQTAEYALRAVVGLAAHGEGALKTQVLAKVTKVPPGYLSKVLQALGRADLVQSSRGLRGGFTLARSPETITVLEVVNAVDPLKRIRRCPLGAEEHDASLCPLHRKLDDALGLVEEAFASCSIADLLVRRSRKPPLCDTFPSGSDGLIPLRIERVRE